ncbi:EF-hand domain-containing protein [Pseudohalocynthiibacter sp. F2068]|jgi:Ca2+-binding EF-hand superfamily protein|uniref:EF-hand domain-containing protein n=1 Tax=Pseudohalocynthiibacter sp. F2068 TaxID=2926418 RepID=UPI001FF41165|nr:EF-hand domain-containing protein [Pseudohalocynthiibacter sp. F2068]MCK0101912.1 EF-hand domain-containing protein [Pseudohalocynthiibacter sp. F2068]
MKDNYRIAALVALMVGAIGVTGVVEAREGHGRYGPEHDFSELDADGDGLVTMEEMVAHREARFDSADTNSDGFLSAEEMTAQAQERVARRVARMIERHDENGDGQIGKDEMNGHEDRRAHMFERMDSDGDGAISEEEFEEGKARHAGRRHRHGEGSASE